MRVVSGESMKSKIKGNDNFDFHNYVMVDTSHLLYGSDDKRLIDAIEVVGQIQTIQKANDILKKLGENQLLDVEIFYKVVERILNPNYKMSELHIERFYNELRKQEAFRLTVEDISQVNFTLSNRIEYTVLGLSYRQIGGLGKPPFDQDFGDFYFQVHMAFIRGDMEYSKFMYCVKSYLEAVNERQLEIPA